MDTIAYIRGQLASVRGYFDIVLKDLTEEQLNWAPPGTLSPISAILLHTFSAEDFFTVKIIQGKPLLWDDGPWQEQIGIRPPGGRDDTWAQFRTTPVHLEPVLDYGRATRAATDAWLDAAVPADLERMVRFGRGESQVAEVFMHAVMHTTSHAGEVAALKGLQGGKGLPF